MIDYETLNKIALGGLKQPNVATTADVSRQNIIDALGIKRPPLPSFNTTPTFATETPMTAEDLKGRLLSDYKEPSKGGIFDVPILGDFISAVDKPRSFIVSTIKEIGDIFVDDQSFSLSEWWNQGQNHIMMGEIFRDWDIGPEGLEGFIFGLTFDIALDPLTYLAGAGLMARAAKADDVSRAFLQIGKQAEKAGDLKKAERMFKAEEAVTRSGSILAAGDALADVGIQSGLRFTIPATGRLGRTIIEKPLRALNPRLGQWLDMKRIGQLSPELVGMKGSKGPLGFLDNVLDTTNDVVQKRIFKRMDDIRNNVPMAKGFDKRVDTAARIAMNMPVEAFKIPFSTGNVLAKGTGALGKTWRGVYATKYGYKIANGLSTKAVFTKAKGSATREDRLWGLYGYEIMGGADASAGAWKAYTINEFEEIARNVDKAGADLGVIMRGAEMPLYQGTDALGNPMVNQALLDLDPIFGKDEGIALWKMFSEEGTGFWHRVLNKWNNLLPYSGHQKTLNYLKNEFYGPHFLTDDGYRAVKRMGPDDVPTAGERLGPTGLRGSATQARRERMPAGIIEEISDDWTAFRVSKDYLRLNNRMGLSKNTPKEEFLANLQAHLNEVGEEFSYTVNGAKKEFNNRVLGQPIRDYNHPLAGGLDARGQADKIGREIYGADWVEKFATDPRTIITRYVTQMDQTFRTEYVLDAFQEAGIIVKGSNGQILMDVFGSYTERSAKMFGNVRKLIWDNTKYGDAKQTRKGDKQGLVSLQDDVDRIAAEINDYEDAINWLDNPLDDVQVRLSNTVSQLDIQQGRRIVTDFAQIDGLVVDLFASIGALQRGSLKGISPRALALLEGQEIILDLTARSTKRGAKGVRTRAGLPEQKGLPKKLDVKIPRPQTKTPTAQELVDALRNKKQLDQGYEEAALLIKRYAEIAQSLRAINQAIGEQIGLVGKRVPRRAGKEFKYFADDLVDETIRPKNVRDIQQGDDLTNILGRITPEGGTGVTPTEYLTQFQRRIEAKIAKVINTIDGLQSKLANNIVNTDPTTIVASLIQKINLRMGSNLDGLESILKGIDGPTLNYIRRSLDDLRSLGPEAVAITRRGLDGGLPSELTEELIKYIVGVTKGTGPTAAVQARNLPLDILEQLAVKMGPKGGGALQQWVKSVKELEKIYAKIGARLDDHLVPSLDEVKNIRNQLRDELDSGTEKVTKALTIELEKQIAKGLDSPKNRAALAALEGWSAELANVRIAGEETLEDLSAKWTDALEKAMERGYNKEELLKMKEMEVNDAWATLKQLRQEYDEVLTSPILKDRVSAVDDIKKAIQLLGDRRMHAAFSDAWNEQAQKYLLNFYGMGGAASEGNLYQISNYSKNRLKGYSLISERAGLSTPQIELFEAVFQAAAKTFDPAAMGDFQKKYLSLVNWWKAMAISTTGFIWRNTLGGFWLNHQIAGVPLSTHTRVLGIRWMAKRAGNGDVMAGLNRMVQDNVNVNLPAGFKIGSGFNSTVSIDEVRMFRNWYASGVAESGQVTQEIHSVLDTMGSMTRKEKLAKGGTWNPAKAEFYPAAGIRILNQDAEFMLRGAVAHHTMMTGGSVDDAFRQAENFHFNYSDLTNTERKMKMVVPFWTWQKNIIPVLLSSMGKNPKAWARLQQVKGELELHSDEEGIVPDFFAENMGIRTPWKWNNDRVYVLPDLPFRDMSRWLKEAENPKDMWKSPARAVVESSLPWFKLPIELWAGKQTFADIPITGRYQQAPVWAEIPVLKQVLQSAGILQTNSNGQLKMRDNHIYMLDQFHPLFARIRRLVPNEEGKQERHFATIINTSLGLGIRMNTPRAQRGQLISDQVEMSQTLRDLRDLESREI